MKRSAGVIFECITAIDLPNLELKRETVCGVKEISGTKTIADFPSSTTFFIALKYTSVLPLPVTPSKTKTSFDLESIAVFIDLRD